MANLDMPDSVYSWLVS